MLSHLYQCLFIHIPKCGGTVVERYFYRHAGGYRYNTMFFFPIADKRMRKKGLAQILNMYPGYFSFTFVRNPYDRFVSYYLHGMHLNKKRNYVSYRNFQECIDLASELLEKRNFKVEPTTKLGPLQLEYRLLEYEAYHCLPQKDFLPDYHPDVYFGVPRVDKKPCSFIGRLENFSADFAHVQRILDLPRQRIKRHAGGRRRLKQYRHYSTYYDRDTRRQVEELYAEDLEILGYEYEQEGSVCVPSLSIAPPLYELQKAEQCKPGRLSRIQALVCHWKISWHKLQNKIQKYTSPKFKRTWPPWCGLNTDAGHGGRRHGWCKSFQEARSIVSLNLHSRAPRCWNGMRPGARTHRGGCGRRSPPFNLLS